ncbi:MAG TPA: PKD domain-containing protein [Gemmataceae bacterium]|nr:PKD domain-containing protein [Gemmataceae bacterium]
MIPIDWKRRRTSNGHTRRPCRRPSLEQLEDRLHPSINMAGDVFVASSANALNGVPDPTTQAGLIRVDSGISDNFEYPTANESAISGDRTGFMSMPDYIVPIDNNNPTEGFYVTDQTAFGRGEGAVLQVNPPTQAASDNEMAIATDTTYYQFANVNGDNGDFEVPTLTAPTALAKVAMTVNGLSHDFLFIASSGSDGFPNPAISGGGQQKDLRNSTNVLTYFEPNYPSQRNPNIVMIDLSKSYNVQYDPANNPNNLTDQQTVVYPDPTQYPFPAPQQPTQDMLVDPTGMVTTPRFPNDIFVLDAKAGGSGEILDFTLPASGSTQTALGGPYVVTGQGVLNSPVDMAYDPTTGNLDVVEAASGGTVVSVSLTGSSGSVNGTVSALQGPTGLISNLGNGVAGIAVNPASGIAPGTIYVDTAETAHAPAQVWQLQPSPNGQGGTTYTPSPLPLPGQVLSNAKGMYCDGSNLSIATSPSPYLTLTEAQTLSTAAQNRDSSKFPTGIVTYTLANGSLNTGTLTRQPGLFSLPQGVAEDQQQNLYVADETALGAGAIIHVDPRNGSASLLAWGNELDGPVGVAFDNFNQSLYEINAGDSSFATHSLVQVSLNGVAQLYISDNLSNTVSVFSGIAFDSSNDVLYVLDQGGNVIDQSTHGQVLKVNITGPGPNMSSFPKFGPPFPSAMDQSPFAQPDALTVDSDNGTVFACTEGSGGASGAIVSVPESTSDPLTEIALNSGSTTPPGNLVGTNGIAVGMGPEDFTGTNGMEHNTIFVDCLNPTAGQPVPTLTAFPEDPNHFPRDGNGNSAQQRVSTGTDSGASLGLVTGCLVYDPPLPVNAVNFETGDSSQVATQTNAAIVSSPALDGNYSLQLQRNGTVANAEIRGNGTTYYNLPTASYSFEFEYTSSSGDGGIVNFNDTASGYKAAVHLNNSDQLVFDDIYGNPLATGRTVLRPNQIYTITAVIGTGTNAPWVVSINGNVEMSGTGNLGTTNNGALELGGNDRYTTNYYYDDIQISAIGVGGPPILTPAANQTAVEGSAQSVSLGSFSDMGPGPWTAAVSWGDGTSALLPAPSAPSSLGNTSHTYVEEGTYTVTVTVLDTGDNIVSTATFAVIVNDAPLAVRPVSIYPTAGAPYSGAVATFSDAGGPEANDGTHYSASINWGDGTGTSTGSITLSGSTFTVSGTHTYAEPTTYTVTVTISHEGNNVPVQNPDTVANLDQFVPSGMVKPSSFWEGLQGQELIRRFGLTSSNQTLGQWLATTLPNLYGGAGGAANLSSFTNAQIGTYYQSLFLHPQGGIRLDAEVLATALEVFTTTSSLGGTVGQNYGFTVNSDGLGAYLWNVGSSGQAFNTLNNDAINVFQILLAANNNAVSGEPWGSNTTLRSEAYTVFYGIDGG